MNPQQNHTSSFDAIDDVTFAAMVKARFNEAEGQHNKEDKTNRRLKEVREDNQKLYLSTYTEEQLIDERYEEIYNDNRQFAAVRTIVPFVTGQITAPEVTPANSDDLSKLFAKDFEKALQLHAENQNGKYKVRLSVQDLLIGMRVGIGKWRYDKQLDTVLYERVDPKRVTIGTRSNLFEEPDFLRQELERTPGDLIKQFPEQKAKILELFGITDEPDLLDKTKHFINEDWIFVNVDGERQLVVGWTYKDYVFDKMLDPNWDENGKNLTPYQMVPYVFFNLLNDGSGHIDQTSYMEQGKYLQRNYNKRGQTIVENARYAGTGVPIFAKGAITQKDAAKVRFSPIQRVLLDAADVSKAFTTWQGANLPQYVVEDKYDERAQIDHVWGTPSILQGQQSENKTATQDVLQRNQAEGRQADLLDMIEVAMSRSYLLEAQLMYRYFDQKHYFNYLGNDGDFVSVVVSQADIAKNIGIQIGVKAGTSLPLDRAQKRATLMELAKMSKVGTLTLYRELGLFDDPEKAFKEYLEETTGVATGNISQLLSEVDDSVFDRNANEDLQIVIGGKKPAERDDITPEYVNFLNEYLLTDKYKMLKPKQQANVTDFIEETIAKAQRKADKLALQPSGPLQPEMPPMPPAMPGQPQPGQPAQPGALPQPMQAPSQVPPQAVASAMPSALPAVS